MDSLSVMLEDSWLHNLLLHSNKYWNVFIICKYENLQIIFFVLEYWKAHLNYASLYIHNFIAKTTKIAIAMSKKSEYKEFHWCIFPIYLG